MLDSMFNRPVWCIKGKYAQGALWTIGTTAVLRPEFTELSYMPMSIYTIAVDIDVLLYAVVIFLLSECERWERPLGLADGIPKRSA